MTTETSQKTLLVICFIVISIAVAGFFTGLQSPMNSTATSEKIEIHTTLAPKHLNDETIPATHYSEMPDATLQRSQKNMRTSLTDLKQNFDPNTEFMVSVAEKQLALAQRDQNRAFNGAPPTIPHPIDQMSTDSCLACHGEGFKSQSLQISKMSHQFLANCTQCHVEGNPTHMVAQAFRENSFSGLPAPTGGPRAYQGAPPMIPHSTWMRSDCMSCHGFTGQQGIRTTHPWRENCQQCHAPSSQLEQIPLDSIPNFLPPPEINVRDQ